MLDPTNVPPVEPDEILARFVLFSKHFRSLDLTVKPDAFMPHPLPELSVTRHREATEEELRQEGRRVSTIRHATLYGRADVTASAVLATDKSPVWPLAAWRDAVKSSSR